MARLKVVVLAVCMLFFGTINTLTTKFQDLAVVGYTPDGKPLTFRHPAVQSAFMFFGEMLCLVPYFLMEWQYANSKGRVRRREELERRGSTFRARRVLAFALPAACDTVATTLLNVGLFYTFASTYQMLRGTLVLFAGFFTILILRRRLYIHHWLGMALITGGAALVGAASVLLPAHHSGVDGGGGSSSSSGGSGSLDAAGTAELGSIDGLVLGARRLASVLLGADPGVDAASAPLFGDLCVVAAQAFTALQFILEEKFVAHYRVPTLLAVGLEGMWGMLVCVVALPVLGAVQAGGQPLDSAAQAFREISADSSLASSILVSVVSIGFFNFFGISVTKALSGAARATIDATRTLFIWIASMWLGWERFLPLQVVGFAVLFAGTSLYNELIRICLPRPDEDLEELLGEEAVQGGPEASGYESSSSSEGASGQDEESGDLTEPLLAQHTSAGGPTPSRTPNSPGAGLPTGAIAAGSGHHRSQHGGHHAAGGGAVAAGGAPTPHSASRPAGRREVVQDTSDGEYTMARSMRLGHSTLMPHALDADTETESEGPTGYSPGMSFGSGHTGGLLSQPNIPEGDEENELMGCMSGVDVDGSGSGHSRGRGGGGRRGAQVSIAIGPHGMLSGGVGRGGGGGPQGGRANRR